MRRLSQDEGKRAARIAEQDGFTLLELLVAMIISLVVLGAGTYGLALAFQQNTQVTDRSLSATQADIGLERLVLDLRQAVNGSCTGISGVEVGQQVSGTGFLTTISMCSPTGAPTSTTSVVSGSTVTTSGYAGAVVPLVWMCNTGSVASTTTPVVAPETCVRTLNGGGSTQFHGVQGLTLTGTVNNATTPVALGSTGTTQIYTLNSTPSGAGSLSWVYISASVLDLKNPNNPSDISTVPGTVLTPIQTSAELRNYGT